MEKDYQTIIDEFQSHLTKSGKRYYSDFFIGTTDNAEQSLFNKHNVSKDSNWWIFRTAEDNETANKVKEHFIRLGMRSYSDNEIPCNIVYCYAVGPTTIE